MKGKFVSLWLSLVSTVRASGDDDYDDYDDYDDDDRVFPTSWEDVRYVTQSPNPSSRPTIITSIEQYPTSDTNQETLQLFRCTVCKTKV